MRKIERLPSGKHKVRFRLAGKQTSETFDRKRDAERFAHLLDLLGPQEALDRMYDGEQATAVPTLNAVAADHIRYLTGIEPGTRLKYERLWARTWGPLIGNVRADELTRDRVAEAVNHLALRYAEKSLENQRGLLAGVCDRLIELGHARRNVAKGLRLPRGSSDREDTHEMVCLTDADWQYLYAAMTAHYRPMVRFLVGTGCRWGETVALRCGEVNLEHGTVRIIRALKDSPDGNRRVGVTKTKMSKRTVALPPEVLADIGPLMEGKAASDLLFTAPRGAMVRHHVFWSDHWRPAIWRAQHCPDHYEPACRCGTAHPERCKLHETPPPPCGCALVVTPRIHDLRHTHASWLLAAGVPPHVVRMRLGHESIQTTVDTYGHLLPDAQRAARDATSLVFRRVAIPQQGNG